MERKQGEHVGTTRTLSELQQIDVEERARRATLDISDRIGYPHRGIASRMYVFMRDMVNLAKAGVTEGEMRACIEVTITCLIDDLYPDNGNASFNELRRVASLADNQEQIHEDALGCDPTNPTLLENWGKSCYLSASADKAVGRRAIHIARIIRAEETRVVSDRERDRRVSIERLSTEERA